MLELLESEIINQNRSFIDENEEQSYLIIASRSFVHKSLDLHATMP